MPALHLAAGSNVPNLHMDMEAFNWDGLVEASSALVDDWSGRVRDAFESAQEMGMNGYERVSDYASEFGGEFGGELLYMGGMALVALILILCIGVRI